MIQSQIKDLYGSVSIANGATATIWTYQLPMRMTGILRKIGNGCDVTAAVNGTSFWSLLRNGTGISPYDMIKDILASPGLPRDAEGLIFQGGDTISAFASNGYTTSAKWAFLCILELFGEYQ